MARRRKTDPPTRGGVREGAGAPTLFPGKYRGRGEVIGRKFTVVFSQTGFDAALRVAETLSIQEDRKVSGSDAIEWCVRKATKTPMRD